MSNRNRSHSAHVLNLAVALSIALALGGNLSTESLKKLPRPDAAIPTVKQCTTAVISGRATPDGRPILWKNRDVGNLDQAIAYFDDGRYPYVTIVNAGKTDAAWAGINSVGFAIEDADANNYSNDNVAGPDDDGRIMKLALQTCRVAGDFAAILDSTDQAGRSRPENYGVIDAEGGAAIFEAGPYRWQRFDATDSATAPNGYLVRTNFAYNGQLSREGQWRNDRADSLIHEAVRQGTLSPYYLFKNVSRDLVDRRQSPYPLPFQEHFTARSWPVGFMPSRNVINRDETRSAFILQGVRPNEDPLLSTMFAALGEPIVTVPVPLWVRAAAVPEEMTADSTAPLCDLSNRYERRLYNTKLATDALNTFQLVDRQGGGLFQVTEPVIDSVFIRANQYLSQWRNQMPEPNEMVQAQADMAHFVYQSLSGWQGRSLWVVPDDYPTIQEAVDAALDGDTVVVQPGEYPGGIDFHGRNIVVASRYLLTHETAYIDSTIIDGAANGNHLVAFQTSESNRAELCGLTLRNASASWGAGVYCSGASPTLDHLLIINNRAIDNGGAIYATRGARPAVQFVTMDGNRSDGQGGSIGIHDSSSALVSNSIIWNNHPAMPNAVDVAYCDIDSAHAGEGNFTADPLFVEPDQGNYHLAFDSPCLDAGEPGAPHDRDSSRADIGAFNLYQRDIRVATDALVYTDNQPEGLDSLAVMIRNVGGTALEITGESILPEGSEYVLGSGSGEAVVAPDSALYVWILSYPDSAQVGNATLRIMSNDFDQPVLDVGLEENELAVRSRPVQTPVTFGIAAVYPNPFNQKTFVNYSLKVAGRAELRLFDVTGRQVMTLVNGFEGAGAHRLSLSSEGLQSGVYFLQLSTRGSTDQSKIVVVK